MITGFVLLTSGDLNYKTGGEGVDFSAFFSLIPDVFSTLYLFLYSKIEWIIAFSVLFLLLGCGEKRKFMNVKETALCVLILIMTAFGTLMIGKLTNFTPTRVIAVSVGWVTLAIFIIAFTIGQRIPICQDEYAALRFASILICFSCLYRFYHTNIGQVIHSRIAWEERDAQLSQLRGSTGTVETCAIPVIGGGQREPMEDPNHEANLVIAYYYEVEKITADHLCFPLEK